MTPFLLMGAMSPVSIPSALAQQLAEAFAGIALAQLVRPGTPVLFGSFLSNTDMQSGSPSFGTPESALGLLCTGQLARHYGLPFRSGGALTASQTVDAQASYEAMMTMLPTFLAGFNWVMHSAGWLESGLVSCYEKFIVDIEILRMLRKSSRRRDDERAWRWRPRGGRAGRAPPRAVHTGAVPDQPTGRCCRPRRITSAGSATATMRRRGAGLLWREALDEYQQPPLDDAVRDELQRRRPAPRR
jgi:trimethylamine--corrinoid protein Co-methyltransferase